MFPNYFKLFIPLSSKEKQKYYPGCEFEINRIFNAGNEKFRNLFLKNLVHPPQLIFFFKITLKNS